MLISRGDTMYEKMIEKIDMGMKKTERERHIADDFKVFEEVFDRSTLLSLHKLMSKRLFDEVCGTLATGKEANIYIAKKGEDANLVLKIYRVATTDFKKKWSYLAPDPRFSRTKKDSRTIIFAWAQREYANLRELSGTVNVPRVIDVLNNILVMEFLGKNGIPYPQLKEVGPSSPARQYKQILSMMRKMYKAGYVHSDLSEYNILVSRKLYLIDFAQATILANPNAQEFLIRDIYNITHYFSPYTEVLLQEEAASYIKGDST